MPNDALQEVDRNLRVAPRREWSAQAACSLDSDFTESNDIKAMKRICKSCPVIDLCLNYALANNEKHNIWGGLTAKERQALLKMQRPNLDQVPIEFRDQYQE
jgi:WhiB family redox-sensing transcriptional regulator